MNIVARIPDHISKYEGICKVFRDQKTLNAYNEVDQKDIRGYYIISGNCGHCSQYLHIHLAKDGYSFKIPDDGPNKSVVYIRQSRILSNSLDKSLYRIHCKVKNTVIIDKIVNNLLSSSSIKTNETMKPYMPYTVSFKDFKYTSGTWIVKVDRKYPLDMTNSFIFDSKKVHQEVTAEIKRNLSIKSVDGNIIRGVNVSKYILNPLTIDGKKCTYRCFVIINSLNKPVLSDFCVPYTAKNKYSEGCYNNRDIHITSLATTDKLIVERDEKIMSCIRRVCNPLLKEISNYNIIPYNESKNGYKIVAVDVLIDKDYNAYMLRIYINSMFGSIGKEGIEQFEEAFSEWEYREGVKPLL